jgi:hypothetical protein
MKDRISCFDRQYAELNARQRKLISGTHEPLLYARIDPHNKSMLPASVGEFVLRSASAVEQMIGGITTRLWDDPFEWTLPERMPTRNDVLNYLDEVETSRRRGFAYFKDDDELTQMLPAPIEFRSLDMLLTDTLTDAESLFDKAAEIHESLLMHNAE